MSVIEPFEAGHEAALPALLEVDTLWYLVDIQYGGEREIRTLVRDKPKHTFQACAFSHSASSPYRFSF